VYWLRRIPAETRVVVLVVFLALFQAILLSIFGLEAIKGERRQVEQRVSADAAVFLEGRVAGLLVHRLGHFANEGLHTAFVEGNPARLREEPSIVRGLFTDAFLVTNEGEVLEPGDPPHPLIRPRETAMRDSDAARTAARATREAYVAADLEESELPEAGLALARRFPFALDERGSSIATAFASTPLFANGDNGHSDARPEAFRMAHWIGVLNEAFGFAPAEEARALVSAIERRMGADPSFIAHHERIGVLKALQRELRAFDEKRPAGIHSNLWAGDTHRFYVRTQEGGSSRVLLVNSAQLRKLMDDVVAEAAAEAAQGVTLSIEREDAVEPGAVKRPLPVVPGYAAVARITPEVLEARASERERFYRYIIVFSMVGILCGGFYTARVVMREVKLAKLKSGFVSNVTHELKTPLTSIRMFSDMLRDGQVTDEAERRECLDVIAQETERLGALIQKVLDFGRSESRRPRFRWTTASLGPVVQREVERFRRASGIEAGRLELRIAMNLPAVIHDPDAFREVVSNLLSNAYKYSPPDDRRLRVTLGPQKGRIVLCVEDNGPGVPARERRKIFEQFYRAGDLLTSELEGTGLGLSIARNIVRAHGGRIGVEDREGGGSRFLVVLPAAARARPSSETAATETTR